MTRLVYLQANATDRETRPAFCRVAIDSHTASRILFLAGMVRSFGCERLGDHYPVEWESQSFMSRFNLLGPSLYATASECWWVTPYLTAHSTHGFFTERLNIERFVRILNLTAGNFAWSEDDSTRIDLANAMNRRAEVGVPA